MPLLSPADELAEIRAELARLRAREAGLKALILSDPDRHSSGRWTRVEVGQHPRTRLNPALLPDAVKVDPRYLEHRMVHMLHCRPLPLTFSLRPGWPIRREGAAVH
jgi:hypothetical protein